MQESNCSLLTATSEEKTHSQTTGAEINGAGDRGNNDELGLELAF